MYHLHLNRAALCINCEHIFDSHKYNGKCPICSSTNTQFLVNWLGGIVKNGNSEEKNKTLEIKINNITQQPQSEKFVIDTITKALNSNTSFRKSVVRLR